MSDQVNTETGKALNFYAPGPVAKAIEDYFASQGNRHGIKSQWFVEAAQRDLRARGVPDGSESSEQRQTAAKAAAIMKAIPPEAMPLVLEFVEVIASRGEKGLGGLRVRLEEMKSESMQLEGAA
jgi:hypothetical protein